MKILKVIIAAIKVARLTIMTTLFVAMLMLNIATVAFSFVATAVSAAFEAVTGVSSVTTNLRNEIKTKDRRIASLSDEVAGLKTSRAVTYRGQKAAISEAVEDTTQRIGRRTAIGSSRNFGSMFGEAIPFYGIAVVVAATTWEMHDACETMKDLHQLDVSFNPDNATPVDHSEVCGSTVPTKEELWLSVKESPGEAWRKAKDAMPELPEFEAPKVNWTFWN